MRTESGRLRSLGMCPRPASAEARSDSNKLPPAQSGLSFGAGGALVPLRQQVAERPKPMSADDELTLYASRDDTPYSLMAPLTQLRGTELLEDYLPISNPFLLAVSWPPCTSPPLSAVQTSFNVCREVFSLALGKRSLAAYCLL